MLSPHQYDYGLPPLINMIMTYLPSYHHRCACYLDYHHVVVGDTSDLCMTHLGQSRWQHPQILVAKKTTQK